MPEFLGTDWLPEQFGKNGVQYRDFVGEGIANRPWDATKGRIYLGSDEVIERHAVENRELKEFREHS